MLSTANGGGYREGENGIKGRVWSAGEDHLQRGRISDKPGPRRDQVGRVQGESR